VTIFATPKFVWNNEHIVKLVRWSNNLPREDQLLKLEAIYSFATEWASCYDHRDVATYRTYSIKPKFLQTVAERAKADPEKLCGLLLDPP
jgi:hypothetical protein